MVAHNEDQQAPMFGNPNVPRWVPLSAFDDTPVRPSSSASDHSNSSDDGGVMLPPASVVGSFSDGFSDTHSDNHSDDHVDDHSDGHSDDSSQQTQVNYTGATNAQVHAPLPQRIIRNLSIHGAAHANPADGFMDIHPRIPSPDAHRIGPDQPTFQTYVKGNDIVIVNGAAHANSADAFTGGLNAYRVDQSISAPQPRPQAYANGINIDNGAAHADSDDVYTGGLNPYRVDPSISASQPAPQAYVHGNRTGVVNIPKNDRIYGNMADNRLSTMYGNQNRNMNSRTYGNGITRRGRNNSIQGPPQAIPGSFGKNNAVASNVSRHPHVDYNAPQQQRPVNRMLFQDQHNNRVSNYQVSSTQFSNYQPPNNQVSTNQVPNYQVPNSQAPNSRIPNNQVLNSQVALRTQVPYQTQLPTPPTVFGAPPAPFAAPSRTRAVTLADFIRSGATDDGQPLNPDAQTPTSGSVRRQRPRTNSLQFETPTRTRGSRDSRRNGYGGSQQSTALNTPSRNMRSAGSYGIQTSRAPATSTHNRVHGQVRPPPAWLFEVCNQQPTLDEAMESLPFSNPYETVPFRGNGVVKFNNIPYTALKSELLSALGRNARPVSMPLGSPYYAVHIIMDRNTGKTAETAFIELPTARDAMNTVRAINRRAEDGSRALKIGNREVTVQVSTTEELMEALFPHARAVEWTGYTPRVIDVDTQFYPDHKGLGFTGFCGNEELSMLVKFAEHTSRVSQPSMFMRHTC
jgi:hypothetical protein